MRSINKVILIGNLTRDPERRETPNGQIVTTFGLATNREWVTKDGDRKNSAEFHECVAWARLAEICDQRLKKGRLIYVEGYLKTRTWENEEGIKKYKTEIVVQDMIMLEKRKDIDGDDDYLPQDNDSDDDSDDDSNDDSEKETKETEETTTEEVSEEPETTQEEASEEKTEGQEENKDNSPIDLDLGL